MAVAEQSISLKTHLKTEVRIILGWHNKEDDGLIKTFLKVGNTEFILGKRAKTFLTRHKP